MPAARLTIHKLVLSSLLFVFATGHGDGCCAGKEAVLGPPTETTCPPASSLTYANFGQAFMTSYCTRCHSTTLTGSARKGAPLYHDFDTQLGVQSVANHVDEAAASGPAAMNDQMPPDGAKPTLEERQKLAEWIACGAP